MIKKIVLDRLNHLKSDLATLKQPKLTKILDFRSWEWAINELKIQIREAQYIYDAISNVELDIEFDDWDHTCGDGCCYTYGTDTFINGEKVSDSENLRNAIHAVVTHLGFKVKNYAIQDNQ